MQPVLQALRVVTSPERIFRALRFSVTVLFAGALHAQTLPSFEQVKSAYIPSDAILLDRHGEPLADLRLNPNVRRLAWVELSKLSPAMREALLAAEDKRFFEHAGIDWKAVLGAAWQNIWGGTKRGASTLTMQLAGLLEPTLQLPGKGTSRRSLSQKWDQSFAAIELEKRWSKDQIIEAYFNLAPFRGDLEGVNAASQILLGVTPQNMTRREATILAALLRGPNAKAAIVARRACILAELLKDKKQCAQITQLVQTRLDAPRNLARFTLAPHLARSLLRQPGQQVTTTLDAPAQRSALNALARMAPYGKAQLASILILDNTSGEVLAWVGAMQAREADGLVAQQALTQWWQPFAVELGIEQRTHTAASLLIDGRHVLDAKDARSGLSSDVLSLRAALQTHNNGALREQLRELQKELGPEAFNERLRQLGLNLLISPDSDTQTTALTQIVGAWHALSTGQSFVPVSALPQDPSAARKVVAPAAAYITQDMLADTFAAGWRSTWAMSSADGHQQILVGNTDRFTLLATLTRQEKPDDTARAVQQLWKDIVISLHKEPSRSPAVPEGLVSSIVVVEPPAESIRRDWFIKGTEHDRAMREALPSGARIQVPLHGQSYTLSHSTQAWTLQAVVAKAVRWQVDGIVIGVGEQAIWPPTLGRHRVQLLGPRDEVLDVAEFLVVP